VADETLTLKQAAERAGFDETIQLCRARTPDRL